MVQQIQINGAMWSMSLRLGDIHHLLTQQINQLSLILPP